MEALLEVKAPVSAIAPAHPPAAPLNPLHRPSGVRLQLQQLSARAGLPASRPALAAAIAEVHRRSLRGMPVEPEAVRADVAVALLRGVCQLARGLSRARSVQVVPPLCVALWHVGASGSAGERDTLWIDLVIPQDGRGASATAWAADIKDLLQRAGVPHRAETVHVPGAPGAPDPAQPDALRTCVLGTWGCMSLLESYLGAAGRMPGRHR